MKTRSSLVLTTLTLFAAAGPLGACNGTIDSGAAGGGPAGGATLGGSLSGGASSGGTTSGGANTGGSATGGSATGGSATGGSATGGGSSGGAPGIPPTMDTIYALVLGAGADFVSDGCGSASCHNGEATPHFNANGTAAELRAELVSITSEECGNLKFVVPGMPEQSAMLKVMRDGCGKVGKMPNGCSVNGNCYEANVLAAVEAWIQAGAPE
jgi:hypothetical protein